MLVAKMMVSLDGMVWVSMPSDYARLPAMRQLMPAHQNARRNS